MFIRAYRQCWPRLSQLLQIPPSPSCSWRSHRTYQTVNFARGRARGYRLLAFRAWQWTQTIFALSRGFVLEDDWAAMMRCANGCRCCIVYGHVDRGSCEQACEVEYYVTDSGLGALISIIWEFCFPFLSWLFAWICWPMDGYYMEKMKEAVAMSLYAFTTEIRAWGRHYKSHLGTSTRLSVIRGLSFLFLPRFPSYSDWSLFVWLLYSSSVCATISHCQNNFMSSFSFLLC